MSIKLYTKTPKEARFAQKCDIVPLSPSMHSALSHLFFLPPSPNALSFHYIALFHRILTINFYLTPLLFQHLLPFTSEEDGGWNLLSYGLYCSGHFLINTTDKDVGFQLMQMQQATPGLKLPYCPLSSTLFWP